MKSFDSVRPHLIGRRAIIVGYSETGDDQGGNFVAHVCLEIENGPRVFFQATDPTAKWEIVEEPLVAEGRPFFTQEVRP